MTQTPMVQPLKDFAGWIASGGCMVRYRDSTSNEVGPLIPTLAQKKVFRSWMKQAKKGKPIRTLVPKRRKGGVSTWVNGFGYFQTKYTPHYKAMTVAHSAEGTRDIFDLARLMHRYATPDGKAASSNRIEFPVIDSRYNCQTAVGAFTGSGSTNNFLHISELAKMQREMGADTSALASLISSVPQLNPATMIVIEATGQGPTGEFYRRCIEAQGDPDSDYDLVFLPWFEDERFRVPAEHPFIADDYEKDLMHRFAVTPDQLTWRRRMLRGEYAGNEVQFKWDYPSTLEECFESASGRMYPIFSRDTHVRRWSDLAERGFRKSASQLILGIDFGGGPSPFTCLWIRHWPGKKPGFTVDPDCTHTIREHLSWCRHPETGKPLDENDHTADACRYAVTTLQLSGHVHIEREMYVVNAAAKGETHLSLGREVARLSKPDKIMAAICDRAEPLSINDLLLCGLPARPYEKMPGALGQGDIEQGAKRVLALMSGSEWFQEPQITTLAKARVKAAKKAPDGRDRDVVLSKAEQRVLETMERKARREKYQDDL